MRCGFAPVTARLALPMRYDGTVGAARGRHVGEHPKVVAVARHIVHVGEYFVSGQQAVPRIFENGPRHIRMSDHAVRRADAVLLGVAGDAKKHVVGVRDLAGNVGLTDDDFVFTEHAFAAGGCRGGSSQPHVRAPVVGTERELSGGSGNRRPCLSRGMPDEQRSDEPSTASVW